MTDGGQERRLEPALPLSRSGASALVDRRHRARFAPRGGPRCAPENAQGQCSMSMMTRGGPPSSKTR